MIFHLFHGALAGALLDLKMDRVLELSDLVPIVGHEVHSG